VPEDIEPELAAMLRHKRHGMTQRIEFLTVADRR
jgi:hypothetical protein